MKILFISKGDLPDYQCDMIFHGARSLFGKDFVDANRNWFMYKDKFWNERAPNGGNSYGRGFTIAGSSFDIDPKERESIKEKIESRYFDYIIYGSATRCQDHLQTVIKSYPKEKVIFIDGEDISDFNPQFTNFGHLFKRELQIPESKLIHPINFCIPKELILSEVPEKTQDWGAIEPGKIETYIFNDVKSYYEDYQKSYFGLTIKKGGFDCLRHYEILMNGCIPYFPLLEDCPAETMKLFPKDKIIETNKIAESTQLDLSVYKQNVEWLLDYTRKNLTTEVIVTKMLETII